jgi:deoxyadenosine/deoxycytidine kinase
MDTTDSAARLPHNYLVIEGNIGAGKTTLCRMLADRYQRRLVLEAFADNPFLPYFYENPERYAFPVELFFMTERHKQLQQDISQTQLFSEGIVADYFFGKTLLFAGTNLADEEFRLFQRLYRILNGNVPRPDLLVYLHRPVEALLTNIRKRGRDYEQDITPDYLTKIQNAYLDYFRSALGFPILILELGASDFLTETLTKDWMLAQIERDYPAGLHRLNFSEEAPVDSQKS